MLPDDAHDNFVELLKKTLDRYYLGWESENVNLSTPISTIKKWLNKKRIPRKGNFNRFLDETEFDSAGQIRLELLEAYLALIESNTIDYENIVEVKHNASLIPIYGHQPDYQQNAENNIVNVERIVAHVIRNITDLGVVFLSIEGQGGIGKTAIANLVVKKMRHSSNFKAIIWLSIGSYFSVTDGNTTQLGYPSTIKQIGYILRLDKTEAIISLLQNETYLIVIDNIESKEDAVSVVSDLQPILQGNSRVIFTSRYNLNSLYIFIHSLLLKPLGKEFVYKLLIILFEGFNRTISEEKAYAIAKITGGIPLAIHFIARLAKVEKLDDIINTISSLQYKEKKKFLKIDIMFNYIYQLIWLKLSDKTRDLLVHLALQMPSEGVNREGIDLATVLSEEDVILSLSEALNYFIITSDGEDDNLTFFMHSLTLTYIKSRSR